MNIESEENKLFRPLIENYNELVSIFDDKGRFLYINKKHEEVLGYSFEELAEMDGGQLQHPEDAAAAKEKYSKIIKNKKQTSDIWRFKCKNGSYLSLLCRGAPMQAEDGSIVMTVFATDITENLRMRDKIKHLNSIFYELGSDPEANIKIIVKKTCLILDGICSLYNRLDDKKNLLVTLSGYNIPENYEYTDKPEGHICYDGVIKGDEEIVAISNLEETAFAETDNNVVKYNLKSYIGGAVAIGGEKLGSLCVVDVNKRFFQKEEKEIIQTLAKALSLEESRKRVINELNQSIVEKDFLIKEMSHRVKNNLNMITSLLNLKEETLDLKDVFADVIHQIDAIRIVHEKLYLGTNIRVVDVKSYFTDLLNTVFGAFTSQEIALRIDVDDFKMKTRDLVPFGLLVNEIATNTIKYGFTDGVKKFFSFELKLKGGICRMKASNKGPAIPEDVNIENSSSLGMKLIYILAQQLEGVLKVIKSPHPVYSLEFEIKTD
jgi:PAS domain S-box-containing protein